MDKGYQCLIPSDWIALTSILVDFLAMLVGGFIAVWVVRSIQSKLESEQKLKEYFLSEMISIRDGYRKVMDDIYRHVMTPQEFRQRMTSLSIMSTDIMRHLKERYKIDDSKLLLFQLDLNVKITETLVFQNAYSNNTELRFSTIFENDLRQMEADSNTIFNEIFVSLFIK